MWQEPGLPGLPIGLLIKEQVRPPVLPLSSCLALSSPPMASLAVNHGQIPICQPLTAALNGSVKRENNGQEALVGGYVRISGSRRGGTEPKSWLHGAHLGLLSPIVDGQPAGSTPDDAD